MNEYESIAIIAENVALKKRIEELEGYLINILAYDANHYTRDITRLKGIAHLALGASGDDKKRILTLLDWNDFK